MRRRQPFLESDGISRLFRAKRGHYVGEAKAEQSIHRTVSGRIVALHVHNITVCALIGYCVR
jgi:hypothetical protein